MNIERERLLDYRVEESASQVRVFFSGRMTFDDNDCFGELLNDDLLNRENCTVVFDFDALEFIDSSGVGMILIAFEELNKRNCVLNLDKDCGQVSNVFGLTKVRDYIKNSG